MALSSFASVIAAIALAAVSLACGVERIRSLANPSVPKDAGGNDADDKDEGGVADDLSANGNDAIVAEGSEPPPPGAILTVTPKAVSTAFRNPRMGWVVYDFFPFSPTPVANTPLASVIYSNFFSWGDLEPAEGQYDFSGIDNMLAKTLPGQKVAIAIVTVDPTSHPAVRPHAGFKGRGQTPYWLQAKMGTGTAGRCITSAAGLPISYDPQDPYACVFTPYYWHPAFIVAHSKLTAALARRYGQTPPGQTSWQGRIETIEISTFGYWGEWHDMETPWPSTAVQKSTLQAMVDHYFTAFAPYPEVKLEISGVVSRVSPENAAGPAADLTSIYRAVDKGANIARKFLGGKESVYLSYLEGQLLQQRISDRSLRLEWASFSGKIFDFLDPLHAEHRGYITSAVDRALEFQASHIGWHVNSEEIYCAPGPLDFNHCSTNAAIAGRSARQFDPLSLLTPGGETLREYAQRRVGYRFELKQASLPQRLTRSTPFTIATTWNQVGVAKLYDSYRLKFWLTRADGAEVALGDGAFTANGWPPGLQQNRPIDIAGLNAPAGAATGWWTLKFAVVDRLGKPAMNLAIEGKEIEDPNLYSRYTLGSVYLE